MKQYMKDAQERLTCMSINERFLNALYSFTQLAHTAQKKNDRAEVDIFLSISATLYITILEPFKEEFAKEDEKLTKYLLDFFEHLQKQVLPEDEEEILN